MTLPRRRILQMALGAVALSAPARFARAQSYPARPVRLIVGFAAGGAADITARLIGQWLSDRLGQPFLVENRPAAGGNIAIETVVNASPNSHTWRLYNPPAPPTASPYDKLHSASARDIAPVAGIIRVPTVMQANPSVPASTVPEFIAYAKANPDRIN